MAKRRNPAKKTSTAMTDYPIDATFVAPDPLTLQSARTVSTDGLETEALVVCAKKGDRKLAGPRSEMAPLESLIAASDFSGDHKEIKIVFGALKRGLKFVLAGLGDERHLSPIRVMQLAGAIVTELRRNRVRSATIVVPNLRRPSLEDFAEAFSLASHLANFSMLIYKSAEIRKKKLEEQPQLRRLDLCFTAATAAAMKKIETAISQGEGLADGCNLTRSLIAGPSNVVTPEFLAETAIALSKRPNIKTTVWNLSEIKKAGFGGLVAVNQGAEKEARFIIVEYSAGKKSERPIVLVGKGVTFDTGGISIKPSANMEDMIYDMGGSAAVLGVLRAISNLGVKKNVVGLIPTTENMPSGTAYKPGDILTMFNKKTVEVINTDAEGRLILADALAYSERFKPRALVDIATLTGACHAMLADEACGVFSNDPKLLKAVQTVADRVDERIFPLPSFEGYRALIDSTTADIKNTGGRYAGATTAAMFLREFVPDGTPWIHFDIAGSCCSSRDREYLAKGPTAVPVRIMVELVKTL